MKVPQCLRKQILEYEKAGFHVIDLENRSGSHFKITFAEFPEPQFITKNGSDWRAIKNNISSYRRQLKEHEEKEHGVGNN
jgi:hypothetical protein